MTHVLWEDSGKAPNSILGVCDTVQEAGIKTITEKKKCKKTKWLSEGALQIAVKRKEMKGKEKRKDVSI